MKEAEQCRWIRGDGQEVRVSDRCEMLAMILSGDIGERDFVRISPDGSWIRAGEVMETLVSGLDRDDPSRSSGSEDRGPKPGGAEPQSPPPYDPAPPWTPKEAPWRRYFARIFDFVLGGMAVAVTLGLLFPAVWNAGSFEGWVAVLGVLVGFPVLDAVCLSKWQTSPGKWLLSVRTVRPDGRRLTYGAALGRAYGVMVSGMWFGIPILAIIPLARAHLRASRGEAQPWEKSTGTRTEVRPLQLRFWLLLIFGVVVVYLSLVDLPTQV